MYISSYILFRLEFVQFFPYFCEENNITNLLCTHNTCLSPFLIWSIFFFFICIIDITFDWKLLNQRYFQTQFKKSFPTIFSGFTLILSDIYLSIMRRIQRKYSDYCFVMLQIFLKWILWIALTGNIYLHDLILL